VLAALLSLLAGTTGCRTLASLGVPVGGAQHKILDSAKEISQAPDRSIQAPTESSKAPLEVFPIEIGDTILIETTNFDASVQLPGDQIVKPDGYISLGECGRLMVMNKTIEQIQAEAQLLVDDHVRQELEVAFEVKRRQRQDQRERERLKNAKLESDSDELDTDLADLDLDAEIDQEQLLALQRSISEAILTNKVSAGTANGSTCWAKLIRRGRLFIWAVKRFWMRSLKQVVWLRMRTNIRSSFLGHPIATIAEP